MMEFMMSRVSVCICAALMIGLMFTPVTDYLMDRSEDLTDDNCTAIGEALDRFMCSGSDEMILFLNTYLPGEDHRISFKGRYLEMTDSDSTYVYMLKSNVIADSESYGIMDILILTNDEDTLNVNLAEHL